MPLKYERKILKNYYPRHFIYDCKCTVCLNNVIWHTFVLREEELRENSTLKKYENALKTPLKVIEINAQVLWTSYVTFIHDVYIAVCSTCNCYCLFLLYCF